MIIPRRIAPSEISPSLNMSMGVSEGVLIIVRSKIRNPQTEPIRAIHRDLQNLNKE
jgi:hypothetical protein